MKGKTPPRRAKEKRDELRKLLTVSRLGRYYPASVAVPEPEHEESNDEIRTRLFEEYFKIPRGKHNATARLLWNFIAIRDRIRKGLLYYDCAYPQTGEIWTVVNPTGNGDLERMEPQKLSRDAMAATLYRVHHTPRQQTFINAPEGKEAYTPFYKKAVAKGIVPSLLIHEISHMKNVLGLPGKGEVYRRLQGWNPNMLIFGDPRGPGLKSLSQSKALMNPDTYGVVAEEYYKQADQLVRENQ